jgi:hypothetical protein
VNVESGILSDKDTLEDVSRSLEKIIETEQKSKQSPLISLQPRPRILYRHDFKKAPEEIKKVLGDIETISKSSDPRIRKSSRGLLNRLERSSMAMEAIRDDETLMKTYRDLSTKTFKDIEALNMLLGEKQLDSTKSLSLDENENVVLRDITGTKPEETQRALKKAEEILETAIKNSQKLLEENGVQLGKAIKNSEPEKRLLIERDQLLQTIENTKNVDKILGVSVRKENALILDKLNKAIDLMENPRAIRTAENNEAMSIEEVINQLEGLLKSKDDVTLGSAKGVLLKFQAYVFKNVENINWNAAGNVRSRVNIFENSGSVDLKNKNDVPLYQRFLGLGS